MTNSIHPESEAAEQPFISHLVEMRDRLLRVVVAVLAIFIVLFAFSGDLFEFIARPQLEALVGSKMISTGPIDPFFTPMKLALVMSIFVAMPYILFQAWGFIAPGLYRHEKQLVFPLMFSSIILFYAGMAFAYYVVFPIMFKFLAGIALAGVESAPDIARYLDIVLKLFFAFGLAFEIPIATILLVWTGVATPEGLRQKRPYVIVGAFVVGMLLTPPDIISQTLLAIPMLLLFELGLFFSTYMLKVKRQREAEVESAEQDESSTEEHQPGDLNDEQSMEDELDRYEQDEAALDDELDSWEEDPDSPTPTEDPKGS